MWNLFTKSPRQTQQHISLELDSAQEPGQFEELSDTDLEIVIGGNKPYGFKPRDFNSKKGFIQFEGLGANDNGLICFDLFGEDCDVEHD